MNCHSTRAVLDLHAEGRVTPARAKAVAAHLKACAECRSFAAPPPASAPVKLPTGDFKARLAASLKTARKSAAEPAPAPSLELWPRDLTGVALASVALALVAVLIGWSSVPSQRDLGGDDLAAWSTP